MFVLDVANAALNQAMALERAGLEYVSVELLVGAVKAELSHRAQPKPTQSSVKPATAKVLQMRFLKGKAKLARAD